MHCLKLIFLHILIRKTQLWKYRVRETHLTMPAESLFQNHLQISHTRLPILTYVMSTSYILSPELKE